MPSINPFDHRLLKKVHTFNVVKPNRHFHLNVDLSDLEVLRQGGLSVAAVLYCTRILEVLAEGALKTVRLRAERDLAPNIDNLYRAGLIPAATQYWAHALRNLGNDARHARRAILAEQMGTALVFLDRWLHWFFRTITQDVSDSLTLDGQPLFSEEPELHAFVV